MPTIACPRSVPAKLMKSDENSFGGFSIQFHKFSVDPPTSYVGHVSRPAWAEHISLHRLGLQPQHCGGAMKSGLRHSCLLGAIGLAGAGLGCSSAVGDNSTAETNSALTTSATFSDAFGQTKVISTDAIKGLDMTNPFFQNLGTNGRTCNSCHKLENSLGISVAKVQAVFNATGGLDPIFRINDGSNAPSGFYANTSTVDARKISFSMLWNHGGIRVG